MRGGVQARGHVTRGADGVAFARVRRCGGKLNRSLKVVVGSQSGKCPLCEIPNLRRSNRESCCEARGEGVEVASGRRSGSVALPLVPSGQSWAEESGGGLSDSAQVGAADGAGAEGGVALQSGESGDPIVDWTTSGTARWMIDASGCLTIAPLEGEQSGELENWSGPYDDVPWDGNRSWIISAKIEGAIAIPTAAGMFSGCSLLKSLDLSGLDTSRAKSMRWMFLGCSALRKVTFGEKFSSKAPEDAFLRGYLPAPEGESLTGKWLSWADGKAYAPVDIPSNVAATYSAERSFPDVDYDNDWFAPAVTFASSRGLITGYSDTGKFGPLDTLTRGQLATILWRNACPDAAASYDASKAVNETGLDGIADHEYYTEAANWAFAKGVITGFERPDGTFDFAAGDPVSFEQMLTIISLLGAKPGEVAAAGDDLSRFADGDAASPWSRSPIAWAAEKGLVGGYENADGTRTLAPGEDVQRGRAATVLMRAFDLGIME